MKIECHILQNYPPHCLNRDDTNSPKDCEFGGVRRARISSQCLKRSVREAFKRHQLIAPDLLAVRTKRLITAVGDILVEADKKNRTDAIEATSVLLESVKLPPAKEGGPEPKTEYLLFLPEKKIRELAKVAAKHWHPLFEQVEARRAPTKEADPDDTGGSATNQAAKKGKKRSEAKKQKGNVDLPKEVIAAVRDLLKDASQTPELALFGRMIADNADWNVDAACQVAHAISTNRVTMDFDFYTAVDDRLGDADTGSDMMGTVQFNSSCFYRYAVVDTKQLVESLGGEDNQALAMTTVEAFLRAFIAARPSGKQNSMAANTMPSVVLTTVRNAGDAISLANAFVEPVTPNAKEGDLIMASSKRLADHFEKLTRMYPRGLKGALACSLDKVEWSEVCQVESVESVDMLIDQTLDLLKEAENSAA